MNAPEFISLFLSVGAIGVAVWVYEDSRKESRIDNFVTRYIALKTRRDETLHLDDTGMGTLLDAGVLWLQSDEEIRIACERINSCRVRQPFIHGELLGQLRELCILASKFPRRSFSMIEYTTLIDRAKASGIAI